MSEIALWKMIKDRIAPHAGKWMRVENPCLPGTPDVHYCWEGRTGWLELKEIEDWPARPDTPVRIPHFTKEQRLWIWDYAEHKGVVRLLLRVRRAREYLLFGPKFAVDELGFATRDRTLEGALLVGGPQLPVQELLEALWDAGP